mmetsp:Transcript_10791/g.17815  ORF Transcript_10791/g.17815 Transcript_10791/m.17815 type:complete len:188 (+) Transcript_10791:190-753(+)
MRVCPKTEADPTERWQKSENRVFGNFIHSLYSISQHARPPGICLCRFNYKTRLSWYRRGQTTPRFNADSNTPTIPNLSLPLATAVFTGNSRSCAVILDGSNLPEHHSYMLVSHITVVFVCAALSHTSHLFGARTNTHTNDVIIAIGIVIYISTSEEKESSCNNCAANMDCHTLLLRGNCMAFPSSKD